jgi:enoyl-CoA hydratase/carnithine racemase
VGGGLQLALGTDIRVVAPDAQLGVLEIRWGIVPDMGGTQLLPALVGPDRAKDLIFTGRLVDGNEALSIGLATRVSADPRAVALALASEIASKNPEAIRLAKRLVDVAWTATLAEGLRVEQDLTGGMAGSINQREAVLANQEQRSPRYFD